jgi:surface carbohydrate biosynthesis protein
MNFSRLVNILKILVFSKKQFFFPKKREVLILDNVGSEKIKKTFLGNIKYEILHVRGEYINLPVLFVSLINFIFYGKDAYTITYIKFVRPKIVLTFIDTSLNFCRFMNKIKNCKFIIIQNGRRQGYEILPFLSKKIKYKLKSDYYFVFNNSYAKYIKKYITTNCIVGGSILNNSFKKNKKFKTVKKIQYISDFHSAKKISKTIDYEAWEFLPTKYIFNVIIKFCKEKKLKLEILGRTNEYKEEINFYKKFNFPFKFIKKKKENYSSLSSEAIVVGMSTTLLAETFSRQFRTAFFDIRNSFYTLNKLKPGFAFPYKTKIFGKFWSNTPHEKKMYGSLIFLYSVSKSEWINIVNKWSEILMVHSYNNLIYKKIFKKVGLKINL